MQNTGDFEVAVLDEIDTLIIELLRSDGRITVAAMAADLRLARASVSQRLDRLRQSGVVRVLGLVDPAVLGRDLTVAMRIGVRGPAEQVAAHLAELDEVQWVGTCADLTSIELQASVRDREALHQLCNDTIRGLAPVISIDVGVILAVHVFSEHSATPHWSPLTSAAPHTRLDNADRTLLQQLQIDGRATITHLAGQVGLSVPATRQRMLRLLSTQTLRIVTFVDPVRLGQHPPVSIHIRASGKLSDLLDTLAHLDAPPRYAIEQSSFADLSAYYPGAIDDDRLETALSILYALPNVTNLDLVRYRKVLKETERW